MSTTRLEQPTEDLEHRVSRIEQILPTLATKEDLKTTEERLRTEIGDSEKRMRTHFDVVTESLRDDIRLVTEAVATLVERQQ